MSAAASAAVDEAGRDHHRPRPRLVAINSLEQQLGADPTDVAHRSGGVVSIVASRSRRGRQLVILVAVALGIGASSSG